MLDFSRKLLAAGMLLLAVVGLMPLMPLVFGYYQAKVTQDSSATYYPQTVTASTATPAPLVFCELTPEAGVELNLKKNTNYSNNNYWFWCTNNWGTDVSVSISLINAGGSGLTMTAGSATGVIPAGTSRCVRSTLSTPNVNNDAGNIRFRVALSAVDLSGTVEFAVAYKVAGTDSGQCAGTRAAP